MALLLWIIGSYLCFLASSSPGAEVKAREERAFFNLPLSHLTTKQQVTTTTYPTTTNKPVDDRLEELENLFLDLINRIDGIDLSLENANQDLDQFEDKLNRLILYFKRLQELDIIDCLVYLKELKRLSAIDEIRFIKQIRLNSTIPQLNTSIALLTSRIDMLIANQTALQTNVTSLTNQVTNLTTIVNNISTIFANRRPICEIARSKTAFTFNDRCIECISDEVEYPDAVQTCLERGGNLLFLSKANVANDTFFADLTSACLQTGSFWVAGRVVEVGGISQLSLGGGGVIPLPSRADGGVDDQINIDDRLAIIAAPEPDKWNIILDDGALGSNVSHAVLCSYQVIDSAY